MGKLQPCPAAAAAPAACTPGSSHRARAGAARALCSRRSTDAGTAGSSPARRRRKGLAIRVFAMLAPLAERLPASGARRKQSQRVQARPLAPAPGCRGKTPPGIWHRWGRRRQPGQPLALRLGRTRASPCAAGALAARAAGSCARAALISRPLLPPSGPGRARLRTHEGSAGSSEHKAGPLRCALRPKHGPTAPGQGQLSPAPAPPPKCSPAHGAQSGSACAARPHRALPGPAPAAAHSLGRAGSRALPAPAAGAAG